MPELPEVETIARALRQGGRGGPPLLGQRIERARVLWERSIAEPLASLFEQRIAGQAVHEVGRRAKFLVMRLDDDYLLVHLRMSGDLRLLPGQNEQGAEIEPETHDRVLFSLASGQRLAFNDARKFGRMWLVTDPQSVLGGLGPEPLAETFTAEELFRRLQKKHRPLKTLLLDQAFLAGLGNIYSDEALHLAGLHPRRYSDSLSFAEAERLLQSVRSILQEGIARNGASIDWVYRGGSFQNGFRVYQRTGQPCPVCGTPVARS